MELQGKVILVTGGAQGMGASHVARLVKEGAKVVFGDVQNDAGRALEAQLGQENCRFVLHDVCSAEQWQQMVGVAEEAFGPIDGLVNNAGIYPTGLLMEQPVDGLRRALEINTVGSFLGIQAVVPSMRRRGSGSIVNLASLAGMRGIPGLSAYSASKWAVRGLTQVAAQELGAEGIRINSVLPGAIGGTGMNPGIKDPAILAAIPMKREGNVAEVSDLVVFLLSDRSTYITGTDQVIDGGRGLW